MSIPHDRAAESIAREERYGAHNYHPLDVVLTRGEGVWVWDVDGNKYMDCLAAYSAVNQGHCHPKIFRALVEQSARLALTSRAFRNDQLGLLYETLARMTGFRRALPMNTGAEAVETAIKAARKWAYDKKGVPQDQAEILVFQENFHGRTTTIVGFSTDPVSRKGFGPYAPGFRVLPYGDADAVEKAMNPNVAAILIEPIQGEAGIIVPPQGYLKRLRELADQHGCLLMMDEIQSGLGRTGKLFAYEHEGIRPDVVVIGKALSGGFYPISAMLSDDEVMDVFTAGTHGSTYGGNPVAAVVARAALQVIEDEKLVERSAELGTYALKRLRAANDPMVQEIRGKGLWIGLQLRPEAGGARRYCEALQEQGLLCKETHEHTIRLAPPLVIQRDELDWALERIEGVLAAHSGAGERQAVAAMG